MKTADDHVLEYALGRVLGRSDAELTQRILDRCRQGRRALRDPRTSTSSRRRAAVLVAAALPIALGILWMWPSSPAAITDVPVLSVRGADWSPSARTSFDLGDVLVVSDVEVQLRLATAGVVGAII